MFYLATYFDVNYLAKGLTLYKSIAENCADFRLFVLCLDAETWSYFEKNQSSFPNLIPITIEELEEHDSALQVCKTNRSKIEFYFTLSPCLPIYLIHRYQLPHICTLDADILFLSRPTKIFDYLNDYSIIVTPHKFSKELERNKKFGVYNVSFQIFKNDEFGMSCLNRWREQCIEWCGDTYDEINERFADQKYLDEWHNLFPNRVKDLDDNVCGLAPWNLNNYNISLKEKRYYSNKERIVFFHFHHFKFFNSALAFNGFSAYRVRSNKAIKSLYLLYWNKLADENFASNTFKEHSLRYYNSNKLFSNVYYEKTFFLRVSKHNLMLFNLSWLSSFVKWMLRR